MYIEFRCTHSRAAGHGYALKYYPLLEDIVKEQHIGIEVCSISNQMLRLINDLRNHPAASWVNRGMPVTISNDDPIVFGTLGIKLLSGVTVSWHE